MNTSTRSRQKSSSDLPTVFAFLDNKLDSLQMLRSWGLWARGVLSPSGYKSQIALFNETGYTPDLLSLTPDEFVFIDQVVSSLKNTDPESYKLIILRHLRGYNLGKIAACIRRRRSYTAELCRSAEARFHNQLIILYAQTHQVASSWAQARLLTTLIG